MMYLELSRILKIMNKIIIKIFKKNKKIAYEN